MEMTTEETTLINEAPRECSNKGRCRTPVLPAGWAWKLCRACQVKKNDTNRQNRLRKRQEMDGILSAPRPARKKAKNHHLALPVTSSNSDISTVPTFTDLLRDLSTNVANAQDYPLDPVLSSLDPSQSRAGYAASSTENTKPGLAAPQNLSSSQLITQLRLHPHPEGTYQTTGDAFNVLAGSPDSSTSQNPPSTRYCLLTPTRPHSYLHRHQADSLHFLHQGRARFVCFGPKDQLGMAREVRSHVLGPNVGESRQVRVPGGWWRYVELLDEDLAGQPNAVQQGMLMSQVCFSVPQDQQMMSLEELKDLCAAVEHVHRFASLQKYIKPV